MPVIYLLRHGPASFGTDDYDVLSPLGERQAEVAERESEPSLEVVGPVRPWGSRPGLGQVAARRVVRWVGSRCGCGCGCGVGLSFHTLNESRSGSMGHASPAERRRR